MSTPLPMRQVKCPSCGQLCEYDTRNTWRPFCSARCQSVDLGAWASQRYSVAEAAPEPDSDPSLNGPAH